MLKLNGTFANPNTEWIKSETESVSANQIEKIDKSSDRSITTVDDEISSTFL